MMHLGSKVTKGQGHDNSFNTKEANYNFDIHSLKCIL